MIARLPSLLSTTLLVFGPLATLSSAWMPHCLDPITAYTNGMPLASTDPLRSHNVNYRCDEYRVGCCGGHYHIPCLTHAVFPNTCCAFQPWPPAAACDALTALDGIEADGVQVLGSLPAPGGGFAGAASPPAASGAAPSTSIFGP